jgi:hypothetical protein
LASQIFPDFIKLSIKLKPKHTSLITPSRWFTAEAQDGSFIKLRDYMRDNNHIVKVYNYPNTSDLFDKVEIAGGVNYFLYSEKYNGDTTFITKVNHTEVQNKRPLFEEGLDIIISDSNVYKIIERLRKQGFSPMSNLTTGRDAFGITGKKEKVYGISGTENFDGAIELRCAYEEIRYIDRKAITRSLDVVDKWKVFTSKGNGGAGTLGDGKPVNIIGKAYIGKPGSVCTDSLLPFGKFSTKEEALNLQTYMKTKFFRFCVGILKTSQNLYQIVYRFVPIQNFLNTSDINWHKTIEEIDAELYKKYNLSEDEIAFIESMIKPMN